MIGGMTEHDGHPALATHLAKLDDNESIAVRFHGLSAGSIAGALAELRSMALGCRTGKPLIHAWASPGIVYSEVDWEHHRAAFEEEFGLEGFPCIEVFHRKLGAGGRTAGHVHRVYLRIDIEGKVVRTSHSAIRQEKVSRIAEVMAGEHLTSGRFNTAVIARLRQEGRDEVADAMLRAGLGASTVLSAPTPAERAAAERHRDLAPDEVWRRANTAWRRSDDGVSFIAALADSGLRIAQGERCPVVVTPAGAVHPLLRAINKGGERQDGPAVRKADLTARLMAVILTTAGQVEPVPGFEAGVFAITNLNRLPVLSGQQPPVEAGRIEVPPPPPTQQRRLTREQEVALIELEDAFHSAAAARAKATREAIEAEVLDSIVRGRTTVLKQRIAEEKASWDLPSIGAIDWREAYRAELAGLPKKYGAHLRWVERLDAERRRVVLKSGVELTLAPSQARSTKPTTDAIAIMIAHAQARGWRKVTISGGTEEWRHDAAKAAIRAGLDIADTALLPVADAERIRMGREQLLDDWWRIRERLATMPRIRWPSHGREVLSTLARLSGDSGIAELVTDEARRSELLADIETFRRSRVRIRQGSMGSRAPRPG